jgi:hypothetical protein
MMAGFLTRRVFLSSALLDLSLARWLAREILSSACLAAAAHAVAPAACSETGQFSLFRVLVSLFRPLWPLRLLAILRWLRPPFLSIAANRDDHSSAVAADQGRLFLDADYVSVGATRRPWARLWCLSRPTFPGRGPLRRVNPSFSVVLVSGPIRRVFNARSASLPLLALVASVTKLPGLGLLRRKRHFDSGRSPFLFSRFCSLTLVGSSPPVPPLVTSTPLLGLAAFRGVMLAHAPTGPCLQSLSASLL